MAIKKQYFTNLKNVLTKTDNGFIGIHRTDDKVYVCNGHIIVKMSYVIYSHDMDRNHFPELDENQCITRYGKLTNKEWNLNSEMDIAKIYEDGFKEARRATLTKLTYDLSNNETARLIVSGKQLVAIASHYFNAAFNFCDKEYVYGSTRCAPVYILDGVPDCYYYGFMILPVNIKNVGEMTLKEFIAA